MKNNIRSIVTTIAFLLAVTGLKAQVLINEFSASNATVLPDEYGKYGDWIELYNAGNTEVNLYRYCLSDDPANPGKWRFPQVKLGAQQFITLFASDSSKLSYFDHWETVVKADDLWRYKTPNASTDTNWRNPNFSDLSWNQGRGGFGYGDGDDSTVLQDIRCLYLRKRFSLADTSQLAKATLSIDYDDAFVAYLNGIEIARSNIGTVGQRPAYTDYATIDHEALMYNGGFPENFEVNMSLFRQALRLGNNVLAIEVHNVSGGSSDFTARPYFSIGVMRSSVLFPAPGNWSNLSTREYLHTNFKLSKDGETLVLSDSSLLLLDQKFTGNMQADVSYGRSQDGANSWCFFSPPSPNSSNNASFCYSGFANPPVFSLQGGYYTGTQSLSLATNPANAQIRYTTDGSTPSATSTLYLSAISIDSCQTIKARCFMPGLVPSAVIVNTYLINQNLHLPVFSLSTNPANLWSDSAGIYVLGPNASSSYPYYGANYWKDWERPVSVEYFDKEKNKAFQFDGSFKINGNYSRVKTQKSFEVMLDNDYGQAEVIYPLIPEKKNVSSYSAFVLRNAGTDWNVVHYRDGLMQRIMKNTHTGYLGYEPCELFLNGRYWGVYEIRSNDNHHYVKSNFGYEKDEIDLLFEGGDLEVKNGSDTGFFNMYNFAMNTNPSSPGFYSGMNQRFDLENYSDYFIAETYYVNNDWIGDWSNNIKLWRPKAAGGKWKYILYDLDFGCGLYSSHTYDKLKDLIDPNSANYQSDIFNRMILNPTFRNYFINRYADLINTIYAPQNVRKLVYEMRDSISTDMPKQFARWGSSMATWAQNINTLINFTNKRPARALNFIQADFDLDGQVQLTLQAYPAGAGRIQISTIVPDSLPWKGTYFNGNPVKITAIPNPGYSFDHWKNTNNIQFADSTQSITIDFNSNDSVVAFFTGSPIVPNITFSEINYQSAANADAGDWVELYNPDTVDVDLSGWKFSDNDDNHRFTFPLGTVIKAKNYLVLAEDLTKFSQEFENENNHGSGHHHSHRFNDDHIESYSVSNVLGPLDFGFANTGELLRLYDYKDSLHRSMTYSKLPPWPLEAAGMGYTLESVPNNPDLDNGDNWFAGCLGGSPGTFYVPVTASINADSVLTICQNDSIDLEALNGPDFSFQWFKDSVALSGNNQNLLRVGAAGDYSVRVSRLGCEAVSGTVKVKVQQLPNANLNAGSTLSICAGSSFNLTVSGGVNRIFDWYKNDSLISSGLFDNLLVVDSGVYKAVVHENTCQSISAEVAVSVLAVPNVELTGDSNYVFCEGLSQLLEAPVNAAYTYVWTKNNNPIPGANSSSILVYEAGDYRFISNLNGCALSSASINISLNEAPATLINHSDTLVLCNGESLVLQAFQDSNYQYAWFKNDTLLLDSVAASLMVSEAGTYKLKTQNASCSAQAETVVLVLPSPTAIILADSLIEICAGTAYQLRVNKNIGYGYQWMKDSLPISNANDFKYDVSDSGSYYAIVNLNSCYSHSNSIRVQVHQMSDNQITALDTTVFCSGGLVDLQTNYRSGYTYQWYKNSASIPGQQDTLLQVNQSGNYTLLLTDSLCTKLSNSIEVKVNDRPLANLQAMSATHLCAGQQVLLSGSAAPGLTYQWFKNGTWLADSTINSIAVSDSGNYKLIVADSLCASVGDSIDVTQNAILSVQLLNPDSITTCPGVAVNLQASSSSGSHFNWLRNGQLIPFATDSFYAAVQPGLYAVQVSDDFCATISSTSLLMNYPTTLVSLAAFIPICAYDSSFELSGGLPLGGIYSGTAVSNGKFFPSQAAVGLQPVTYTYTDSNTCEQTASTFIEMKAQVATPIITQNFDLLESNSTAGNQWFYQGQLIPSADQTSYKPTQNGLYGLVVYDSVLCHSDTSYFNYLSLLTPEQKLDGLYQISPNPSSGDFLIKFSSALRGTTKVEIIDALGRSVYMQTVQLLQGEELPINLVNSISQGAYTLRISNADQRFESKLVIY